MTDGEDFATFEQQQNAPADTAADDGTGAAVADTASDPDAQDPADPIDDSIAADPSDLADPADVPKPNRKPAAERIAELVRKGHDAEREAKYWRDVAEGRARPPGAEPPSAGAPKAPNPQDYDFGETDPKYIEAVIDYRVEKGLDKVRNGVAQDLHIQAVGRAWEAKQDAARSDLADYDEKVIDGAHNWPCSEVAAEAIRTSDAGPRIAYHLASHPDEARRINGLSPLAQVLEIGKIGASVNPTASAPAKTTNAPKPPGNQARGAGGHFAPNAATTDFREFETMANRKA